MLSSTSTISFNYDIMYVPFFMQKERQTSVLCELYNKKFADFLGFTYLQRNT